MRYRTYPNITMLNIPTNFQHSFFHIELKNIPKWRTNHFNSKILSCCFSFSRSVFGFLLMPFDFYLKRFGWRSVHVVLVRMYKSRKIFRQAFLRFHLLNFVCNFWYGILLLLLPLWSRFVFFWFGCVVYWALSVRKILAYLI